MDVYDCFELFLGFYEFLVIVDYCKNNKFFSFFVFIFMIDVFYNVIRIGFVRFFCEEFKLLLDFLFREGGVEELVICVGFVIYNKVFYFYNVKSLLV